MHPLKEGEEQRGCLKECKYKKNVGQKELNDIRVALQTLRWWQNFATKKNRGMWRNIPDLNKTSMVKRQFSPTPSAEFMYMLRLWILSSMLPRTRQAETNAYKSQRNIDETHEDVNAMSGPPFSSLSDSTKIAYYGLP